MRYETEVIAFDMLDMVHIAVRVRESNARPPLDYKTVYSHAVDVAGTGESDPKAWLRDALVKVIEDL